MKKKQAKRRKVDDFSSDRPIESSKADRLGRKTFAEGLADRIQSWRGKDSLVVAVCGEWGCGKTSLKNMVLEKLHHGSAPNVDVLEFNPWEISGRDSLAASFFNELGLILTKGRNNSSDAMESAQRLETYAKRAALGASAVKFFGKTFSIFGGGMVGVPMEVMAEALSQSADVTQQGAETLRAVEDAKKQSLAELKQSITKDMANLERPVVIVIDDIDRLTTDEIREIFQLVKANANFPNLIYLLLFDRRIVSDALNPISGERGHEYLDKIVQVLFHVPQPSLKSVHKVLFEGLDFHLADAAIAKRWDNTRWGQVWSSCLSNYFPNLRCVYRFLGSFGFHVTQMRSSSAFELNPLDLLVLEIFRLFEPSLYEALPASRRTLVNAERSFEYLSDDERKKRQEGELERLLSLASEKNRKGLRATLTELFPALLGRSEDSANLIRQLRVGHDSLFDRYFTMSLASDDLSQTDLDALRDAFAKPGSFARICDSLRERDLLETAFTRLDAYKDHLRNDEFPNLIISLVNISDSLPERDPRHFLSFDTLAYAWRLIYFGLKGLADENERFSHLRDGLTNSVGVRLAVYVVEHEKRNPERSQEYLVSEDQWEQLKDIAVERIRTASHNGRLRTTRELAFILFYWQEWAAEHEVKSWITENLKNSEDALWILRTFLSMARQESINRGQTIRYLNLKTLEEFASIEKLTELIASIEMESLQQDDLRALRAFKQALIWREEGKPDGYYGQNLIVENPLAEDT